VKKQTATYIAGIKGVNVGATAEYVVISGSGQLGTAAGTISSINPFKLNAALAKLEERNNKLEAMVTEQAKTIAQQQREFKLVTAALKEQASLLQKVSAEMQVVKAKPEVVSNN
jgi:hypothetical protein